MMIKIPSFSEVNAEGKSGFFSDEKSLAASGFSADENPAKIHNTRRLS